ncbi:MAG: histidine kinase, partial [Cytophagaceae bacterium]|nr:histidine kinase [Gemmatimonadaceae bacterium]
MILRGRSLRVYFASWLPFVVLYAVAVQMSGAPLLGASLSALTSVGTAALLGLVAVRLMPVPAHGRSLAAVLLRHAAIGLLYSSAWTAVISAQIYFEAPRATWDAFLAEAMRWQFLTGLILYSLLVAVVLVIETVARLREQERRAARAEALRVTAELQALRAQLNPHFLFNTLHSITALVRSEPRNAEVALERLAACLRHVLDVNRESREELPLGDELAFVRDYLALERMRFGDRLRVVEEVDPETLDAPVLAFLLQPLVENAIRHGLAPLARPVTVRIAARHEGEELALEVADDGAGSDSRLASTGSGVGLRAVRQRLQARYGDAATLYVTTAPGEGCRVHVRIPAPAP